MREGNIEAEQERQRLHDKHEKTQTCIPPHTHTQTHT